ncbi:MAG: DNA repair protein RadA, partial [Candidatus Marinimicrobia bacterium]|nr:DNA repair protein RadA [Candidatus Neomarinimicrobiota bacterium]
VPGSIVIVSMEGTRPILIEIQALVSRSSYGTPQRNSTGVDNRRLSMMIAVLEKRAGVLLGMSDVFVNLTGGLKISETSIDLGIVVAMASSFRDKPVDDGVVIIGEVGLGGEVRPVSLLNRRLKEAFDLGFKHAVIPKIKKESVKPPKGMRLTEVASVSEALTILL